MKHYSPKLLPILFIIFTAAVWWLNFRTHPTQTVGEANPELVESKLETQALGASVEQPKYPLHDNIKATVFWVGEAATSDNDFIHNRASAWTLDWISAYGGIDTPKERNGWFPEKFTPKENPFYVALPYSDYTEAGIKTDLSRIYWYSEPPDTGGSLLKNRWVKINRLGRSVYAQWEDVGPFESDDVEYVFGDKEPVQDVGIDLSPAAASYLGIDGVGTVSWRFVDADEVPEGPWADVVTTNGPDYR